MADSDPILFYFTFIFEIGSVLSIILLVYSLYLIEKIKRLFPGGSIVKKWITMQIILIALIVLYALGLIFIFHPDQNIFYIITGTLILFSGLFIVIIIILTYKTYQIILHKAKE